MKGHSDTRRVKSVMPSPLAKDSPGLTRGGQWVPLVCRPSGTSSTNGMGGSDLPAYHWADLLVFRSLYGSSRYRFGAISDFAVAPGVLCALSLRETAFQ